MIGNELEAVLELQALLNSATWTTTPKVYFRDQLSLDNNGEFIAPSDDMFVIIDDLPSRSVQTFDFPDQEAFVNQRIRLSCWQRTKRREDIDTFAKELVAVLKVYQHIRRTGTARHVTDGQHLGKQYDYVLHVS